MTVDRIVGYPLDMTTHQTMRPGSTITRHSVSGSRIDLPGGASYTVEAHAADNYTGPRYSVYFQVPGQVRELVHHRGTVQTLIGFFLKRGIPAGNVKAVKNAAFARLG